MKFHILSLIVVISVCIFLGNAKKYTVPLVTFSNGKQIPIVGLGTSASLNKEATQAVKDAIDIGYRHIDTAEHYSNEEEIGQAIKEKIADGTIKREDIFITDKLWSYDHEPELVEPALNLTLKKLGVDYIDLYLIHWPFSFKKEEKGPNGEDLPNRVDYVDTWKAMENLYRKGLAKSIGLSNFNKTQLRRVLQSASIRPVNLQIESNPYLNQKVLIDLCKSENITVTAYSPLGSPGRTTSSLSKNLLKDARLKEIADKYKKSPAQVALRYQIERGVIIIPKTVSKSRLEENINIFDFHLTPEEVALIDTFNINERIVTFGKGFPDYPFEGIDV